MQVRLKVLQGSKTGKEIKLPMPQCLVGRSEECHLRPQTDAISRRHCLIMATENEVVVRDLKSRNGTFVNGERVEEEAVLLSGDQLRVGPLSFEVVIETAKAKRPKVHDIKDVAARTAETGDTNLTTELEDIDQWLEEADEEENTKRQSDPETRQFRLDDTSAPAGGEAKPLTADADTKAIDPESSKKPAKKAPGKLPPRPSTNAKDSREAAADMLKKFFNRR
jgi:pSer/pThr/pTyr-binding forkhead associated (FHA) protein